MSGKSSKRPYSASSAPNGRGSSAHAPPNAATETMMVTRRRRHANANLHPPARNHVAIEINRQAAPSISRLAHTIRGRQAALSRRTARRGAIPTISIRNRLRLRGRSKSRSASPAGNRAINVYGSPPNEIVVNNPGSPHTAIVMSRPVTPTFPNERFGVVVNNPANHEVYVPVRSKSRSRSRSRPRSRSK